jgi:hypothetical protein
MDKQGNPSCYNCQGNLISEAIRELHNAMNAEVTDSGGENVGLSVANLCQKNQKLA